MKRSTLLIAALALSSITYGQVSNQGTPVPFKDDPVQTFPVANSLKGSGDVFWSTSFNWGDPETKVWTLPDGWVIADLTDLGNYWMWRSPYDTLGGCCTWSGPSTDFKTPLDGYLVLPADEYNLRDGVGTGNPMNSYIITPVIDCSSKTSVTVRFKQLFRLCCGTTIMQMLVTNDGGVHWAAYDCEFAVGNNRFTDFRYQNIEFNITDVAAGMANVQIKFSMSGNSHYFWMIDDLELAEAFNNDLVLADYWADFNGGFDTRIGHINYWPLSQMGMASSIAGNIGDYMFKGAFLNNGNLDQENTKLQMTILRNGAQVFQDVSNGSTIWSLERDTATVNSAFLASDYGNYQFNFNAISDNAEEVPLNNSTKQGFTVTDTLFHRADFTAEAGSNTGGWVGGGKAGDMVGVYYDIYTACEINSMTAYISGVSMSQTPSFQYVLYKDMGADGKVELITSDVIDATLEQRGTYVTLDMQKDGETEFLEPGLYLACVRFWGVIATDPAGSNGISVGWDMDNNQGNYTYMYFAFTGGEYNSGKVNMIGIDINSTGGPSKAPVTFNVDLNKQIGSGEFNPATDLVNVTGLAPTWNGTVSMTDPDGDGIYSATVGDLPVAGTLHYKYSINGTPEAYPMTGNLYRSFRVNYWNTLADTYNFGRPVFVFNVDMTSEISSGKFIPGTDTLQVAGLGNTWKGKAALTDPDGNGIYSAAVQNITFGVILNYKYSINSEVETFPLTGDPFRKWTVRYWNSVNDIYNIANTSGLNQVGLIASFNVYPNPTPGAFTVAITNTVPSDLIITLTNIQGQVVYQNNVKNVVNYQESIDNKLSKGFYFLTVNTGKEVKVQKVIVQ